jgi:membrane protein YdbS with pleckstrin-like domain
MTDAAPPVLPPTPPSPLPPPPGPPAVAAGTDESAGAPVDAVAKIEAGDLPPAPDLSAWRPLPAAARGVFQGGGVITGLILGLPLYFAVAFPFIDSWLWLLVALAACPLLGAAVGFWMATRRWASTFWRLDERGLQVRRGHLFHHEVFVPRSRVQHLDLERGPIERHFGLATIVVHTAGTRLQALRQSGLAEADALALRDALVPAADSDDAV